MSTLPDLTTSNVGYIAYWNAINQGGVGSINASDALSDPNIQNYTLYDNGFVASYQISFNHASNRYITVRVKQDGWFVAYIDRTNNFTPNASSRPNGYWDILDDWTDQTSNITSFPINTLERSIHSLQSYLSNSGNVTYNSSDVGLYNYEYSSATTSTQFSSNVKAVSSSGTTETSGLLYTSNTNVMYAAATGNSNNNGYGHVSFGGTTIESNKNPSSLNLISNNLIPSSQTEYDMSIYDRFNGSAYGYSTGTVLTIWS